MKNKSLILLIAILLNALSFGDGCIVSHADENSQSPKETMSLILTDANLYIAENYDIQDYYPPFVEVGGVRHEPSLRIYKKYKLIGYYSDACDLDMINPLPEDKIIGKKGDELNKEGEVIYRYLGYDAEGRLLYNPHFPPDSLGEKPDESGLVDWGNGLNRDWADIINDASRGKIKEAIEANFKKSLVKTLRYIIDHYFLYHRPGFPYTQVYYDNWLKFLKDIFSADFSTKINVILLPTTNAHGLAVFKYKSGYYSAIYLKYQEKTDAFLRIHHIAVDEDAGGLRVSPGFHPVNTQNDYKMLKEGEKISISAHKSEAYDCVGHSFHANKDAGFTVPKPGSRVVTLVPSTEFNYIFKYEFNNDRPHLIFYYKKRAIPQPGTRTGKIVVSSPKYHVSKAIPTDENVRIESMIDDADLCSVSWGGGKSTLSIPVEVTGIMNEGFIGSIDRDIEYYKLHDYSIYKLNRLLVKNPKLDDKKPIIQYTEPVPEAVARTYSQNVMGLTLPFTEMKIGGLRFNVNVKTAVNYSGEEPNSSSPGINSMTIELSAVKPGDFFYVGDFELKRALDTLESACTVKVRNDYLSIAGRVISDDSLYSDRAPKPKKIAPRPIVLVKPEHHIDNVAKNGDSLTTGTMIYEKELGFGPDYRNIEIEGNNVFIHTPVLNSTKMEDVSAFDQRTEEQKKKDEEKYKDSKPLSLPLDHVTELDLATEGKHLNEKGYGTRDYEEHLKAKLIKIPFDAYISKSASNIEATRPDNRYFLSVGSLLRLEPSVKKVYLKAAPWVTEGLYHIKSYMAAKNAGDLISSETYANLDFNKEAAEMEIAVLVSGRLFDFTVERVLDPSYQSSDGGHYWDSGSHTKEARPKKRFISKDEAYVKKWTLPLSADKSPYKHRVKEDVKLGYPLVFSVKSMGTFFSKEDVIVFKPRFYHIAEDGSVSDAIALFYKRDGSLIRFGSGEDDLKSYAVFKSFAGLDNQELIEDSRLMYGDRAKSHSAEAAPTDRSDMLTAGAYMSQVMRSVLISKPAYALSSSAFRVFAAGSLPHPAGVTRERSGMSLQKWYGSYHLPASTLVYALNEEGEADFNKRITKGSIGLAFDIGIARGNNEDGFELGYVTDSYNGWKTQAYQTVNGLPEGLVVLYSIDKSMDEDYVIK